MTNHLTVRWHGELDFDATDPAGASVSMSSNDEAISPGVLLLAALGGCTGMDTVLVMSKKRMDFKSYRAEVSGEVRETYPQAYTSIVVEHIVEGHRIPDKAVSRAIELSARKYCTVGTTIATGDCTIKHRLRITDEAGERTSDCLTIGPRGAGLNYDEGA